MIHTRGLSRCFDDRVAVDNVSFSVDAGEIVSLLGPNGAGKTTTFRLLSALLLPTSGGATVNGVPLGAATAAAVRSRVGLLTENPGLWERLSVRWNLRTFARLHGVANEPARVASALEAVGLTDRADERAGALSKGLKQRVALARALIHDPPVVLLDEPTSGLDPASAREVRTLILRLRGEGRTVLVSTHNLAEAEALSDRIAVLSTRLLAFDTPKRLRARVGRGTVEVAIDGEAAAFAAIAAQAGASVQETGGGCLRVRLVGTGSVPDLVTALVSAGARIERVTPQDASLEDAYLALVKADD